MGFFETKLLNSETFACKIATSTRAVKNLPLCCVIPNPSYVILSDMSYEYAKARVEPACR